MENYPQKKSGSDTKYIVIIIAAAVLIAIAIGIIIFALKSDNASSDEVTKRASHAATRKTDVDEDNVILVDDNTQATLPDDEYGTFDQTNNNEKDFSHYSVGEYIPFGTYEQDGNLANGTEPIEWLILDKDQNSILLISRYGLNTKTYNNSLVSTTWASSPLRYWLNNDFYADAFSDIEKAKIVEQQNTNDDNASYGTDGGENTSDKVYLLSINEAKTFFGSDEQRRCVPSVYAVNCGARQSSEYTVAGVPTCWWWLRSPGDNNQSAACVKTDGPVQTDGVTVDTAQGCVRPVIRILF